MLKQVVAILFILCCLEEALLASQVGSMPLDSLEMFDDSLDLKMSSSVVSSEDSAMKDKHKPTLKRSRTMMQKENEEQVAPDRRKEAIQTILTARARAQENPALWSETLATEKRLRKIHKLTDKDFGQVRVVLDPKVVTSLPKEERLSAMRMVANEQRYKVPLARRQSILNFELERVKDPAEKEKKQQELKPELALNITLYTSSQEEARDVEIPNTEKELLPLKTQQKEIQKQRGEVEQKLKELGAEFDSDEGKEPEKKRVRFELKLDEESDEESAQVKAFQEARAKLVIQEEAIIRQRYEIAQKQEKPIQKIMRDFLEKK